MGLRDKWAESREQERTARETEAAYQRRTNKSEQLRKMGVTSHAPTGILSPSVTEADLDAMIAAEQRRRSDLYIEFVRVGTVITFRALGVQVLQGGDTAYTIGYHDGGTGTNASQPLGLLAGAQAQVTHSTSAFSPGTAALIPLALAPLARKETSDALTNFSDGNVHILPLDGSQAVREARKQCVQFNAMAGVSAPTPVAEDADDSGPAAQTAEAPGTTRRRASEP